MTEKSKERVEVIADRVIAGLIVMSIYTLIQLLL